MNINGLKTEILNGRADKEFSALYSDTAAARARYAKACDGYIGIFGEAEGVRLFSAPGRTEISGNHTDHQHGSVIAGSVDLDVIALAVPTDDGVIRIKSEGYDMDEIDTRELDIKEDEVGNAAALIRGVAAAFKNNGYEVGGFNAYTTSNVLKGSGLSSSAAFEVLVSNIINGIYNDGKVDCVSLAKYSQFAEREYFGKPCGLLDQMASSVGGFTCADFNDPQNPIVEKINLDIHNFGYTLCVVDTGGNHADLTQDYADITVECKKISNALGVEFLRDADSDKFYSNIASLREECGDRAVLRAFHFFNEQQRVEKQTAALKNGHFEEFLKLVNRSGDSSYKYLQNLYPISAPSRQGLSLAIALTEKFLANEGACRVHGGGFAGTVQCYIPNDRFTSYKKMIEAVFGDGSCVKIDVRPVGGYEIKL